MYIKERYLTLFFLSFLSCIYLGYSIAEDEGTNHQDNTQTTDKPYTTQDPDLTLFGTHIEIPPDDDSNPSNGGGSGSGSGGSGSGGTGGGGGKRAIDRDDLRFDAFSGNLGGFLVLDRVETDWGFELIAGTTNQIVTLENGQPLLLRGGLLQMRSEDGDLLWSVAFEGLGETRPEHLAVGEDGLIYLAGTFHGTLNLAGRSLTATGRAGFVAAFDHTGTPLWARLLGGNGWTLIHHLESGAAGLHLEGEFSPLDGTPDGQLILFEADFSDEGRLRGAVLDRK